MMYVFGGIGGPSHPVSGWVGKGQVNAAFPFLFTGSHWKSEQDKSGPQRKFRLTPPMGYYILRHTVDAGGTGRFSRRDFIIRLAALGAGTSVMPRWSTTQSADNTRRIDVHHHFIPEAYLAFLKAHNRNSNIFRWILAKDLEDMDQNGTATAILSITTPGFRFGELNEVRKVSRGCNEAAANLRAHYPGRFGNFATIPLTDTVGALHEAEYALDTLQADGIGLYSNYGDRWLGNTVFAPVYEELNRRKAVVYVHPITANCCANLGLGADGVPNEGPMIEYGTDTTRTIASLIFSGTTRRFPNITWIFAHGGGVMPYIIERFFQGGASAEIVPGIVTKGQNGVPVKNLPTGQDVLSELRKLYYDIAQASNPVAMGALRQVVLMSQILYGTDYWYRTAEETARGLATANVFNTQEMRAINRGNAERILPRYRRA
jgi:predicted TIM-barrel fold metal-dependent hydrolase